MTPPGTSRAAELRDRVGAHLAVLYPGHDVATLVERVIDAVGVQRVPVDAPDDPQLPWGPADVVLITYGDTVVEPGRRPLEVLGELVSERLAGVVSTVHVLPFTPYSSDDGFSVIDYDTVDEALGTWADIESIADRFGLMVDLVLNHVSSRSAWFEQFVAAEPPGDRYFIEVDPRTDLSSVVRPRTSPLLRPTATAGGDTHVWCTFSHDQIDVDMSNPDVLVEYLAVVDRYLAHGATILRLDAVAYVWKRPGTSCVHLPETHELVSMLRTLVDARAPGTVLVTETNVSSRENLSYFGEGDEAHAIYNFSLPPLVLQALLTGSSRHLSAWLATTEPAPRGCTYVNFLASHDGIGLRPVEGLLGAGEIDDLVTAVERFGGRVSCYEAPGGPRPYELNIALVDALSGTVDGPDTLALERYLCAHTIMLGLAGIPALYLHSLLGTRNDQRAVAERGHNRAINRSRLVYGAVVDELDDPASRPATVFGELCRLLRVRARQPAFHPDAPQRPLRLGPELFGFRRRSVGTEQTVFAVHNLTAAPRSLPWSGLDLTVPAGWFDLLSGSPVDVGAAGLELGPYQCAWITDGDG